MGWFSDFRDNVVKTVQDTVQVAVPIMGDLAPIVSAVNPVAGSIMAVAAGQSPPPAPDQTPPPQDIYGEVPVTYVPSSYDAGPTFFQQYKWPLLVGGGLLAVVLGAALLS
jgi:hypothetical protein